MSKRPRFNKERRQRTVAALRERYGDSCWICTAPIDFTGDPGDAWAASLDHYVPTSRGGSNKVDNLRLAHRRCNTYRGNRLEVAVAFDERQKPHAES